MAAKLTGKREGMVQWEGVLGCVTVLCPRMPESAPRCLTLTPTVPGCALLTCKPRTPRPALCFPPRGSFSGGDTTTHSLLPHQQ